MDIAVIGSGYVGLVAGACFAETGNDVVCVDKDELKIKRLNGGEIPIYEPGLADLISRNVKKGRLTFTTSLKDAVERCDVIFIAGGTPQDEDASADVTHVVAVATGIGTHMNGPKIVVDKSTVPVGTGRKVREAIESCTKYPVEIVSNPEFLKEGAAIDDFMRPDRVVVGVSSERAANVMRELYAPFVRTNNPILVMDVESAEMTKYAANSMLAARVSFMNELSLLCDKVGADIDKVRIGIGTDSRIGMSFLFPGIGYGGSCFPKDVQALIRTGESYDVDLKIAKATEAANKRQKSMMVEKIKRFFKSDNLSGKRFGIWGLAFKPRTDDVREAPAYEICKSLSAAGAKIVAYDPEAIETFKQMFGDLKGVDFVYSNYEAVTGVDALIICTEWNEFRNPNFKRMKELMKGRVIFDGRNIYGKGDMREHGFSYLSVGRPDVVVA